MASLRSGAAALLMLSGAEAFSDATVAPEQTQGVQYLFVQKSKACSLQTSGSTTHIVFDGLSSSTTRFSDRPFRKDSNMSSQDFMGSYFETAFGTDLPNAAILGDDGNGMDVGPIVATVQPTIVDGKPAYALTQSADQANEKSATSLVGQTFSSCVVFVDDAVSDCLRRIDESCVPNTENPNQCCAPGSVCEDGSCHPSMFAPTGL